MKKNVNKQGQSLAELFFKKFNKEVLREIQMATYKWDTKVFTKKITELIRNLIQSSTFDKKDDSQTEYYRIDVIGYKTINEDTTEEFKSVKYDLRKAPPLWALDIAVEHENNQNGWMDEFIKLCYIRCPLRVVIGYNYCDKRKDPELGDEIKVKYAMNVIEQISNKTKFRIIDEDQEFLIILGNCHSKDGNKDYDDFGYKGYIIKSSAKGDLQLKTI